MKDMPAILGQDGSADRRHRQPTGQQARSWPAIDHRDHRTARPDSFDSSLIEANGQRLHLVECGEGPMVLLVHGFPESWFSWRHQIPALAAAGYRAVAMSGRGYGRSSRPTDPSAYRITELVADCVAAVQALGESSATIVGHDWGAQVAWASAWMRPDIFPAVVAMGVAFGGRSLLTLPGPYDATDSMDGDIRPSTVERRIGGPELVFYREHLATPGVAEREMETDVASWLRDAYYSYSASAPRSAHAHDFAERDPTDDELVRLIRQSAACIPPGARWRDRFLPAPSPFPRWLREDVMDFYVAEFESTGFTGALNWYRNRELNWELLGAYAGTPIQVPALYIAGDQDPATMFLKDAVARMATRVPRLTTYTIPDCGHWIGEERPDETNAAIANFLARVTDSTRSRPHVLGHVGTLR